MTIRPPTHPPIRPPITPSVIIAGTHSGVGKTTVSMGIMAALSKNLTVQPFKIGPDYIDPSHHTLICKRPSINLDSFMMEEEDIRRSFYAHSQDADISIIEGVMGLHDGVDSTEVASTAHIAKILGIPVVLVVDVKGMSRSTAALAYGYREYDRDVDVSAVILNRAGSERHIGQIEQSLGDIGINVIGALPRNNDIVLPSRHLGLHMANESDFDYAALADFIEKHIDLQRVMDIADTCDPKGSVQSVQSAQLFQPPQSVPKSDVVCDVTIGIAQDSAFCFYYEEMFESLRDHGAKLVFFSPLHDTQVPDVDGIYFGGGYPELFAKELEASPVTGQVAEKAAAGMPIYGECGGFMYLCRSLEMDDANYRFAGVLAADIVQTQRFQALGYTVAEVVSDNAVMGVGETVRGHEFHYSKAVCDEGAQFVYRMKRGKGIANGLDGLTKYNTVGSYMHAAPIVGKHFVESCRRYKMKLGK